MQRTGRVSLTRRSYYHRTLAEVIEARIALALLVPVKDFGHDGRVEGSPNVVSVSPVRGFFTFKGF